MTPLLIKMSNSLKVLNFQILGLAKLVLQFNGKLCKLSAEGWGRTGLR